MSWSVRIKMVHRESDGAVNVVLDEFFDEMKCLVGYNGNSGFDSELAQAKSAPEIQMPKEVLDLFEPEDFNPELSGKYVYYTEEDCVAIRETTEKDYQKWLLRLSKIKEYMDTTEYMKLSSDEKQSVKEELIEAEEMFDGENGARWRFRASMALCSLWWKYYDYPDKKTWLGVNLI